MEQYFSPVNTKGKQVPNKVHEGTSKRKKITSDDNSADKRIKTANAPNPQWLAIRISKGRLYDVYVLYLVWRREIY